MASTLLMLIGAVIQSGSASAQGSIRTAADHPALVRVNVSAVDSKGNPVTDLKAGDLVIEDAKTAREVDLFRYDGASSMAGGFNVSAIVLDAPNMLPESQTWARAQLMRFLQTAPSDSRLAIYRLGLAQKAGGLAEGSSVEVVYDFTNDPAPLRAAVEKISSSRNLMKTGSYNELADAADEALASIGKPPGLSGLLQRVQDGINRAAVNRIRLDRTLEALDVLGSHLGEAPGRTNLVWITHGFSMGNGSGTLTYEDQVRTIAQRMAQNGVTLYIVDAAGLAVRTADASDSKPNENSWREDFYGTSPPRWTMEAMANTTGGRYFQTNDAKRAFVRLSSDLKGAYTLGFRADPTSDGRWHPLKVTCKRPGVTLRYRNAYLAERNRS